MSEVKQMIIYKATNKINGKVYIGQTIQTLERRKNQHERSYKYKNTKNYVFCRALKKYGNENFEWEVIDTATSIEELNLKEEYWISYYDCLVSSGKGYNSKYGGNNHKHLERTKELIGLAQKGDKNHMFGKKGFENNSSKAVIDMQTNIVYGSASECAEKLGLTTSKVCAVCRGERGSTGGRVFRYVNANGVVVENENFKKQKRNRIINTNTGEMFENAEKAVQSIGLKDGSNLNKRLKQNNGVCYYNKIVWAYENVDKNVLESFEIPVEKRKDKRNIKVKNLDTGEIFYSIAYASESVKGSKSGLARALRNTGKCTYKGYKWEVIN